MNPTIDPPNRNTIFRLRLDLEDARRDYAATLRHLQIVQSMRVSDLNHYRRHWSTRMNARKIAKQRLRMIALRLHRALKSAGMTNTNPPAK